VYPRFAQEAEVNSAEFFGVTRAMTRVRTLILANAIGSLCFAAGVLAQNSSDPLWKGFENPPSAARPRVWWHWMNGNISEEGIKLDLDWMHRVGIA
jgi:hypothetical protein